MVLQLPFGKTHAYLTLEEKMKVDVFDVHNEREGDGEDLILSALENGDPDFLSWAAGKSRFVLVISDYSRATGTHIYVPIIVDQLINAGIHPDQITILIALGLHRPATEDEMMQLVGSRILKLITVLNHNPDDKITDVEGTGFSSYITEADAVIITGVVTFHPMAGFSGGYKSLLPGVASRKNIISNHRKFFHGLTPHPGVGPAMIDDNPVLDDIIASCKPLQQSIYCLNVVMHQDNRITYAAAGMVDYAWGACRDFLMSRCAVRFEHRYPVVIASAGGYPADFSFYQCMKVLTNASQLCEPGGELYILAECSHGWEINQSLFSMFTIPLEEAAKQLLDHFRMDALAVYMAMRIIRRYQVHLLSALPEEEVHASGMKPLVTLDGTVLSAGTCAVLPYGAKLLPIMDQ